MALRFVKHVGTLKPEVIKNIEEIKDSPAHSFVRLATTLSAIRKGTTDLLHRSVKEHGGTFKDTTPLVIPSRKNPREVTVFPNIAANRPVESVVEYVVGILNNPKTKVKLETRERALKMVLKREYTTLAKIITEHSDLFEKGYRADQIQAISEKAAMKFVKPRIVICKSPKDCYIAYQTNRPGSCMWTGGRANWCNIAESEGGMYPSAWYFFQPHARLCYLEVGGKPVARFMQYRTDLTKDEWPYYGDLKESTTAYGQQVHAEMKKQGKTSIPGGYANTLATYEVPAIFHPLLNGGKTGHCPLPHCDNQRKDFKVSYDAERKVFIFRNNNSKEMGTQIGSTYVYEGYINSASIVQEVVAPKPVAKAEAPPPEKPKAEVAAPVLPPVKNRTCKSCHIRVNACIKCCKDRKSADYHNNWAPIPDGAKPQLPKKIIMGGAEQVEIVQPAPVAAPAAPVGKEEGLKKIEVPAANPWLEIIE